MACIVMVYIVIVYIAMLYIVMDEDVVLAALRHVLPRHYDQNAVGG